MKQETFENVHMVASTEEIKKVDLEQVVFETTYVSGDLSFTEKTLRELY